MSVCIMLDKKTIIITANQYPHLRNHFSRLLRVIFSCFHQLRFTSLSERPEGISIVMRIKNEADWIKPSLMSIKGIADEIIIVDNGSTDGTYEILEEVASNERGLIKLWRKPNLDHCSLSNFALIQTTFRWVFRWDGDMVAHTSGDHNILTLRDRLLNLNPKHDYLIYLRHINLSGDLFHQDLREMVHIEEYINTYSAQVYYVHPGRFEAIKVPKYYRPLFWYEPYSFHVNIKPARRMLLRYFWEDWMILKDYERYPMLEDYVNEKIKDEFGTDSWREAMDLCVERVCRDYTRFDPGTFGPYPDLLMPYLKSTKYRLVYKNGTIAGRDECK